MSSPQGRVFSGWRHHPGGAYAVYIQVDGSFVPYSTSFARVTMFRDAWFALCQNPTRAVAIQEELEPLVTGRALLDLLVTEGITTEEEIMAVLL